MNLAAPADTLLGLLTQYERAASFPRLSGDAGSLTKARFIAKCVARYPDALIAKRIGDRVGWVAVADFKSFHRLQLLFFGDPRQQLQAFVLQDLGLRRYEAYALCEATRQFADRAALLRYQRVLALGAMIHRADEVPGLAEHVLGELDGLPTLARPERRRADKIRNRLGRWFERRGEHGLALRCYEGSGHPPARERRARIHKRHGDEQACALLASDMLANPRSAEEQVYAQRLKGVQRSAPTTMELPMAKPLAQSVEDHAAQLLVDSGAAHAAWHLENGFSLGLAGLAYWPVVFAAVPGAFVNYLQAAPVDLFWDDFLEHRRAQFEERQAALDANFSQALRETYAAKQGISNRLVNWSRFGPDVLETVLDSIPIAQLLAMARYTIQQLSMTKVGFPDLLVLGPNGCEFFEVKAPGDQLQPAQRIWLAALEELGLRARVLRLVA